MLILALTRFSTHSSKSICPLKYSLRSRHVPFSVLLTSVLFNRHGPLLALLWLKTITQLSQEPLIRIWRNCGLLSTPVIFAPQYLILSEPLPSLLSSQLQTPGLSKLIVSSAVSPPTVRPKTFQLLVWAFGGNEVLDSIRFYYWWKWYHHRTGWIKGIEQELLGLF